MPSSFLISDLQKDFREFPAIGFCTGKNIVYHGILPEKAKNYPFIGTQFHPEKNVFEWCAKEVNIPHSQ
jgi:hypothetical protein